MAESGSSQGPTAHNLSRSAGIIGMATMASRILGLVRDQVMAYLFGAGSQMDAYNVAFRIPNLVRDLFAEGAMSAAFVPAFTRRLTNEDKDGAWRLGNLVVTTLVLVTGAIVLAGIIFAGPLTDLFAGSYAKVPGKLELTTQLTRVMFPFLMLVAVAAAFMGMLNALHRFFVPALSPAMFNVGSIVCTIGLLPVMRFFGWPAIMAPAIGVLVGGLGQVAAQWPLLRREGFRFAPRLDFRDPGLREVLLLMGPGVVGLAAVQINVLVNTILAAREVEGAVSWLNYAFRLMYLPIGLFGVSIATAALPSLSRHAAREDLGEMRRTISNGLRLMLMLNVPATIGLLALASPIVALIFERGRFTTADTASTAAALAFYAPGLIGYSAVKIAVPSFYALRESRTPVMVSIATVIVNVVLNITLARVFGYKGLALGTAIAALFNAGTLLIILRRRLNGLDEQAIGTAFAKILTASVAMGAAAWGVDHLMAWQLPAHTLPVMLLRVTASIAVALGVLDAVARLVGVTEYVNARQAVLSRLSRGKARG
jgi:putative peptidoglycan lipid II flippase